MAFAQEILADGGRTAKTIYDKPQVPNLPPEPEEEVIEDDVPKSEVPEYGDDMRGGLSGASFITIGPDEAFEDMTGEQWSLEEAVQAPAETAEDAFDIDNSVNYNYTDIDGNSIDDIDIDPVPVDEPAPSKLPEYDDPEIRGSITGGILTRAAEAAAAKVAALHKEDTATMKADPEKGEAKEAAKQEQKANPKFEAVEMEY